MVADQIIDKRRGPIRELKTCGQVIIKKRGRLICDHIVAHNGLECEGIVDAKTVISGMPVILGKKSSFKGDLTAPSVNIIEGAQIQPSLFAIGPPMDDPQEAPPRDSSESTEPSKKDQT